MTDFGGGRHCRARSRQIKGLSDIPRAGHLLGLQLKITPGHIESHRVAVEVVQRLVNANIRAAFAYRGNEFEFVMHIMGRRRIWKIAARRQQRLTRLEEKERRLAVRVMPHFAGMAGIVASHAEDSIYRKQVGRSQYRQSGHSFRSNDVSHPFPRFR